jgi:hypothetical protein
MATVTDVGIEQISKLVNGVASTAFTYLANGSGSTAEGAARTALATENTTNGFARAAATCTNELDTTAVWNKSWTASVSTVTVREIGVFDADTAGNMAIIHVYASDKTIEVGESLDVTVKLVLSRAA